MITCIPEIKAPSDRVGPLKEALCDALILPRGPLLPLRDLGKACTRPRVLWIIVARNTSKALPTSRQEEERTSYDLFQRILCSYDTQESPLV